MLSKSHRILMSVSKQTPNEAVMSQRLRLCSLFWLSIRTINSVKCCDITAPLEMKKYQNIIRLRKMIKGYHQHDVPSPSNQ